MITRRRALAPLVATLIFSTLAASSSQARRKSAPTMPTVPTWTPAESRRAECAPGSLWSTDSVALADDLRARELNDVIFVRVTERSLAQSLVSTKTKKSASSGLGVAHLAGLIERLATSNLDPSALVATDGTDDFAGDGSTSRSESLTTTVSGRVVAVLPNGNLHVEAAREIEINNERQYLLLSGVIRPVDVAGDNSVLSSRMADLRLVFAGAGDLSKIQRKGWFLKALSWILPI